MAMQRHRPAQDLPQLRFLGAATLEDRTGAVSPLAARRHAVALLALLATAPARTLARGKVVGMLWPDCAEATARNRLTTCLHQIRRTLGEGVVRSRGDELSLSLEQAACDVCRFEDALAAGDAAAAVACYGGSFLDGFQMVRSAEFEQRIDAERERLSLAYRSALEALAEAAAGAGEPDRAVDWWRRRAGEDRCDARVALRLMQALEEAGNRTEALRVARTHARLVQEEFGVPPDPEVQAAVERLAKARIAAGTEPTFGARPPAAADAAALDLPIRTLAVLPFENLSGSQEVDPFAAGLHDDLLTELSRIRGLTVIARTSVLRFRGARQPVQDIARELGAGTLLEAAVQHAGGRLRLNVQLIDGRSGGHRWAERYDRTLSTESLFDIQSGLVQRIAASLRSELVPLEVPHAGAGAGAGTATADLEAYRLNALGRQQLAQLTDASVRHAVACFRRAIARDPAYALAWAGLADALTTLDDYNFDSAYPALLAEARAATRHALLLAPGLAEAHASLGKLDGMERRGPAAVSALRRAIELQPGYAAAHNWLSWTYQCLGRPGQALESARRAVELDPLLPEAVSNLSVCHLAVGEPARALREAQALRDIAPEWPTTSFYLALALYRLRRFDEARSLLDGLSVPWSGPGPACTLALACAASGDTAEARRLLDGFSSAGDHFASGLVHLALADTGEAFAALDAVTDWSPYWPTLCVHQYFPELWRPLRKDPRFRDIQRRVWMAWGLAADGSDGDPE